MATMSKLKQQIYEFDNFRLDVARRQLLRDGEFVQLSSKAFDLLFVLVESGGQLVTKEELYGRVWANQVVEESNLTVQMSALRKALGERRDHPRYIMTVPGHGYRFLGEVFSPGEDADVLIETETVSRLVIEKAEESEPSYQAVASLPLDESDLKIVKPGLTFVTPAETRRLSKEEEFAADTKGRIVTAATVKAVSEAGAKGLRQPHTLLLWSGGFILALILVSGLVFWRFNLQRLNQDRPTVVPFAEVQIKQLTTKGQVRWAVLSPDRKFYAYTLSERGEYKESLWLGQTDGSHDILLRSPDEVTYSGLAFSPDGRTLYFTLTGKEASQNGLFKMLVLGGVAEKLSSEVSDYFALSPDGNQLAFFRTHKETNVSTLIIVNADGTGVRELLTRPPDKPFSPGRVAWSPDGSLLAVVAISDSLKESREIFTVRVTDGHLEQLTALEWVAMSNLVWLRDGRGLIIVATDKGEARRHLWRVDYPGGKAQRLSRDTDSYGSSLSISADGDSLTAVQIRQESNIWIAPADNLSQARQLTFSSINGIMGWYGLDWLPGNRLVFTAGIDRTLAIYSMETDGSNIKQLTSAGFHDQRPRVTADGRFIIFQSNRSGSNEIWRARVDGGDLKQLTTGGGNSAPHPTPDSRWVVYSSTRDGKSFIFRVPVEGGEPVRVTDKESSYPRVSHDGKLIACGYRAEAGAAEQLALVKIEDGTLVKLFAVPRSARFADGIRWMPDGEAVCYRDLVNGIWRQAIKGGAPQRLTGLPEEEAFPYEWSRDGKYFAFTRGRLISDAVLIKDFK
ncbi:MAG: winged helix-turn-helix domain-containing protein [Acidobacteriota bacterium]